MNRGIHRPGGAGLAHPAACRLFEDGGGQVPLTLLESRAHHNGVVALRYSGRGL
jgi:hypothetical protein